MKEVRYLGKVKITIEVDEAIVKRFEEVNQNPRSKRSRFYLKSIAVNALKETVEYWQGRPIKLSEP